MIRKVKYSINSFTFSSLSQGLILLAAKIEIEMANALLDSVNLHYTSLVRQDSIWLYLCETKATK